MQGEGGFYVAPKTFMKRLRELCDKHGILLIADEVQTGAGRTGTFFAMEQMGVTADLTTFANPHSRNNAQRVTSRAVWLCQKR